MEERHWLPRRDRSLCTGCGDCITRCPTGALGQLEGKAVLVHPEVCTYCAECEDLCPVNAIALPYLIRLSTDDTKIQPGPAGPQEEVQDEAD